MAFKLLLIESSLNHIMCQQLITKHNFIYLMSKVQVSCIPLAFLRFLLYVKQKQGPTLEQKKDTIILEFMIFKEPLLPKLLLEYSLPIPQIWFHYYFQLSHSSLKN